MAKVIQTDKNSIVKKSEMIIQARYKLSPLAIKFISIVITNLKRSDRVDEEYIIRVKDIAELTGQKSNRIYELIDEALNNLLENPLTIPLDDENGTILKSNWVSGATYDRGEVRFMIYPKLRPFLLEVKEKFLKYRLENILPLRSSYSIRLYEILKDWFELSNRYNKKSEKILSISELRDMLEVPKSYVYGMVKKRILQKAQKELRDHTDIAFEFEELYSGRKVTHIKFIIQQNIPPTKAELLQRQQELIGRLKNFAIKQKSGLNWYIQKIEFLNEKEAAVEITDLSKTKTIIKTIDELEEIAKKL